MTIQEYFVLSEKIRKKYSILTPKLYKELEDKIIHLEGGLMDYKKEIREGKNNARLSFFLFLFLCLLGFCTENQFVSDFANAGAFLLLLLTFLYVKVYVDAKPPKPYVKYTLEKRNEFDIHY